MDIASKIEKLWEQKERGLLTLDEFQAAKRLILQGGGGGPLAPAPAPPQWIPLEDLIPTSVSAPSRHKAYSRLHQLLSNIICPPPGLVDPSKVRMVKPSNKILAVELFAFAPRLGLYLQQLGFEHAEREGEGFRFPEAAPTSALRTAVSELNRLLETLHQSAQEDVWMRQTAEENAKRQRVSDGVRYEQARKGLREDDRTGGNAILLRELERNPIAFLQSTFVSLRHILAAPPQTLDLRDREFRQRCWDAYGVPEVLLAAGYGFPAGAVEGDVLEWSGDRLVLAQLVGKFEATASGIEARAKESFAKEQEEAVRLALIEKQREKQLGQPKAKKAPLLPEGTSRGGPRIPVKEALRHLLGTGSDAHNDDSRSNPTTAQRDEDHAANAVIGEITSLVDFISGLREEGGIVSKGRKERHRLLELWNKDRDMAYLIRERDLRAEELKEVQRATGKGISSLGNVRENMR